MSVVCSLPFVSVAKIIRVLLCAQQCMLLMRISPVCVRLACALRREPNRVTTTLAHKISEGVSIPELFSPASNAERLYSGVYFFSVLVPALVYLEASTTSKPIPTDGQHASLEAEAKAWPS